MKLVYTERALADVDLAIEWYESQRSGLGREFLDCLEESTRKITEGPEMYAVSYRNIHAAPTRRFPFSVFYTLDGQTVVVHAVFDNRQNPQKRP